MCGTIILINGQPGVGKLIVARELVYVFLVLPMELINSCNYHREILPNAKVFHNHLLIDPTAALYNRAHPAYYPLRKALVG